nr:hypothetical protein [Methylomarinum sp. Ch1-1]MDP4523183.1 hypothetical protein [Methylomarinum sp. Ch1-1]
MSLSLALITKKAVVSVNFLIRHDTSGKPNAIQGSDRESKQLSCKRCKVINGFLFALIMAVVLLFTYFGFAKAQSAPSVQEQDQSLAQPVNANVNEYRVLSGDQLVTKLVDEKNAASSEMTIQNDEPIERVNSVVERSRQGDKIESDAEQPRQHVENEASSRSSLLTGQQFLDVLNQYNLTISAQTHKIEVLQQELGQAHQLLVQQQGLSKAAASAEATLKEKDIQLTKAGEQLAQMEKATESLRDELKGAKAAQKFAESKASDLKSENQALSDRLAKLKRKLKSLKRKKVVNSKQAAAKDKQFRNVFKQWNTVGITADSIVISHNSTSEVKVLSVGDSFEGATINSIDIQKNLVYTSQGIIRYQ